MSKTIFRNMIQAENIIFRTCINVLFINLTKSELNLVLVISPVSSVILQFLFHVLSSILNPIHRSLNNKQK